MDDDELVASVEDNNTNVSDRDMLMDLGGGTGATIGGTGILELDQDLVRRMRYQDKAVMLLLLVMYFVTLSFSASFAYRQALNNSPVTFYSDPRYHDFVAEGRDQDTFLESFTGSPKDVHLQVTGFVPVSSGVLGTIEWQGEYYYDVFSFALDLSPWVVREGTTDDSRSGPWNDDVPLVNGVVASDLDDLNYYISGIISIQRTDCEPVSVYKNTAWANFMHSRTTKVLCALSVLGWLVYLPYMWLRCTSTVIHARYAIDIPISGYWPLIADKLSADGFSESPGSPAVIRPTGGRQVTMGQLTLYGDVPPGLQAQNQMGIGDVPPGLQAQNQ